MSQPWRIVYDAGLVEAAVLHAEHALTPDERRAFRRERDALYELPDADAQEAGFEALHADWFERLELDQPLRRVLTECGQLLRRTRGCRVARAQARREETADLAAGPPAPGDEPGAPWVVVRLRPETLVDTRRFEPFLRHELMHVDDMLDPAFGYERRLPPAAGGAIEERMQRDRYRAVWCATIDGRRARRGPVAPDVRRQRLADFVQAFPALGSQTDAAFERWWSTDAPRHAALVEFALAGDAAPAHDGLALTRS